MSGAMTALGGLFAWVIRRLIDRSYEFKDRELRQAHEERLEEIRAEHRVNVDKMIGLNVKRAAAIERVFKEMTDYAFVSVELMDTMHWDDSERMKLKVRELYEALRRLVTEIRYCHLYVNEELGNKLNKYIDTVRKAESMIMENFVDEKKYKDFDMDAMIKEISPVTDPIYMELKREFHRLLGVMGVE